jgi:predicted anti-sigma-YlaC factor YlaD
MNDDEFATYDAAYVLGALSPADRHAFEEHLSQCPSCAESVAELAGMPGLLARVPLSEIEEAEQVPVPDTLLPRLLRETNQRRRRTRWIVGGGATLAAAAALVIVLMLTVVTGGGGTGGGPPLAMKPVVAAAGIHADAQVKNVRWGTKITVKCGYNKTAHVSWDEYYALTVTPKHGATQQIATWMVSPGHDAVFDGATALHRDQISRIDVRDSDGKSVLQLGL